MSYHFAEYRKLLPEPVYYYGNANHGMYDLLLWLQRENPIDNPNVILPAYIPAKLYRLALAVGYEPRFYDVTNLGELEPEQITEKIDNNTQAALAIHYFGIPTSLIEIKKQLSTRGVFLIEDCAHTLAAETDEGTLGTLGDAAIFSTRKMLQLPCGGFLTINANPDGFAPSYSTKVRSIYSGGKWFATRMKYLYFKLTRGADPLNQAWIPSTGYIKFGEEQHFRTKEMSRFGRYYLEKVDLANIIRRRRENYTYLASQITESKRLQKFRAALGLAHTPELRPVAPELKDGWVPYSMPMLLPAHIRDPMREVLCEYGVGCGAGWPEAPFGMDGYQSTRYLAGKVIELPIHQGMNFHQLDRIVSGMEQFLESYLNQEVPALRTNGNDNLLGLGNKGVVQTHA
ncbi:MAG: DegT/DnrJ/EryC1/StrS family aminotransferase [Candidatus Marinimicrobia bacterium]|nr:DegT/DnrJ/EryC1/StrS family aminotransferase [Candidatus Neomarinimicrobiota bacterium]